MSKTQTALRKLNEAANLRADGRYHTQFAAARLESEAQELLAPTECQIAFREAIPVNTEKFGIIDALEHPDCVSLEASESRLDLLVKAGALEMGLECAESIQAQNSVERMLAHQMAGSHSLAMSFLGSAANDKMPPVERARLANSARGLMDSFQNATLTLQRLRTGGCQSIVVQRIQVQDTAQAVIAGGGVHDK